MAPLQHGLLPHSTSRCALTLARPARIRAQVASVPSGLAPSCRPDASQHLRPLWSADLVKSSGPGTKLIQTARHEIVRTVSRYESLGEYDRMMDRIVQLRRQGQTIKELAAQLTREGHRTPRTQKGYTATSVRQLLSRRGLTGGAVGRENLKRNEWWLPDLAEELESTYDQLRGWALQGTIRARRCQPKGPWIVWADARERRRLRKLMAQSK
jgi:hypothetical protein